MKASIPQFTRQNIKVKTTTGGSFTPTAPITLKNQIVEINSIEDIADVEETNVINGATLIYNATTDKYEIKPLSGTDLVDFDLDGGFF